MNLCLRSGLDMVAVERHTTLRFQVLAVEVCESKPPTFDMSDPDFLRYDSFYSGREPLQETSWERASHPCEVCVFGVSITGHSIVVRVHGFMPHFFVEVTDVITREVLCKCVRALQRKFNLAHGMVEIEFVLRKRMYGWVPAADNSMEVQEFTFARLSFINPYLMRAAATLMTERKLECLMVVSEVPDVSEQKVAVSEKFLAAHGLKASGWAQVRAYDIVATNLRVTVSQLEVKGRVGCLTSFERDSIAPLLIAAVDIEAHSHDYRSFPDASHPGDMCTYIGTTFWVYGEERPRERVMQVLGACSSPPAEHSLKVFSYATEYELITAWRDLIALDGNPDMVVSYNGTGFDFAYLACRMDLLLKTTKKRRSCRFNYMGRMMLLPHPLKTRELTSAAKGQNELSWFPQPGRVQLDLFMYVKDSQKLSSYRLDDVSAKFLPNARKVVLDHPGWVNSLISPAQDCLVAVAHELGGEEMAAQVLEIMSQARAACPSEGGGREDAYMEVYGAVLRAQGVLRAPLAAVPESHRLRIRAQFDVHVQPVLDASGDNNYRKLFRLYDAGPEARATIAVYCQVDCDLVVLLLDKLNVVANTIQMSQVCNTLADDVCNRGQQIKTYNLISRFASARNYILNVRETGWDPDAVYEGATVLEPHPGYYQVPVATLDFASLYPSLMRAFNLCHSSLVLDERYTNLPGVKYGRYDIAGRTWTFQESTPGLLPDILTSLLAARKAKKKEMKNHPKGSFQYRLCDGAQLALKVSCNSVYGFCGVTNNGMYPCMPVAVATTFNGRKAINMTKKFMEDKFRATVVYGDTDSVMVTFPGVTTVEDAFPMADRAASEATAMFPDAIVLEFEKIFFPYLLVKKKTYAGMKYEDTPAATPTLDVKGLAVVRRDNCELVRDVMRDILNLTMQDRNPMGAYAAVETAVADVMQGRVPLAKLQISNSLKNIESYTNTAQPQLTVVRKMRERHAFDIPRSGDRVPYVICRDAKLPNVSDRAEHPAFVEEHGIPIDKEYYLVSQLQKRLEVITSLLPIPNIARMFERAVACVRDADIDQQVIGALCRTVERAPRPVDAPKLAAKGARRKRGAGWRNSDIGVAPLAPTFPIPERKKRAKGWDAKQADAGVASLFAFVTKK